MKIVFLLLLLLNQGEALIEQHHVTVTVGDVDSYMHDLPPPVRKSFSYDNFQLEKDILGMLNMNIVYDYLVKEGFNEKPEFKQIIDDYAQKELIVDDAFMAALEITGTEFKPSYRQYLLKKELYTALTNYLLANVDQAQAEQLAYDRFKIEQKSLAKPEKRDIAVIKIPQNSYSQQQALEIVESLISDDTTEQFKALALKHSADNTVKYNDGQLGQFHQKGFKYPFAKVVFTAQEGAVPAVFEHTGYWYIVRVNKIIPSVPAQFDDVKEAMVAKIVNKTMHRQFQNIINQYAKHEVQVSKELVDDIFSRYEVFQ